MSENDESHTEREGVGSTGADPHEKDDAADAGSESPEEGAAAMEDAENAEE